MRAGGRGRTGGGLLAALVLAPSAALACALPPSVILTLPTGHYITAAALTVALTALLGALGRHLPEMKTHLLWQGPERVPVALTSYLSFLVFLGLVAVGLFGSRDPMHNLMTLGFWTGVWIVVPLASALFGNLWRRINPWTGPVRAVRLLLGLRLTGLVTVAAVGFVVLPRLIDCVAGEHCGPNKDSPWLWLATLGLVWLLLELTSVAIGWVLRRRAKSRPELV